MKRVLSRKDLPFDVAFPTVEGKCSFCDGPKQGRRRWCSDKCSQEAWVMINVLRGVSTYIRKAVLKRDKGICAGCGIDCEKVRRVMQAAFSSAHRWQAESGYTWDAERMHTWLISQMLWALYGEKSTYGTYWQADHIVEFKAGGEHSMENLQTLCTVCHKAKTAQFAASRSKRAMAAESLPLQFN